MKRSLWVYAISMGLFTMFTLGYGTIIYVPGNQPTIQQGINASSTGDTVLVAPDTYTGANNRDLTFGGRNVTVMSSDGPEVTIIDCQNATRAARFLSGDNNVRFKGFTITNGTPNSSYSMGGGMLIDHASPVISCCIFNGNYGAQGGGAIGIVYSSNPTILNCTFTSNSCSYGGGSSGGAIFVISATATIDACDFMGNTSSQFGGAIAVNNYGNATVRNCTVIGNSANETGGGIRVGIWGQITVYNTIIKGNSCNYYGGGFACTTAYPCHLINCTIIENSAGSTGGGCRFEGYNIPFTMKNSILWDNTPNQINNSYSSLTVTYTDVEGSWGGTGNINLHPTFVDSAGGDYRLAVGSPCIDTGNPDASYNDPEDPGNPGFALAPAMGTIRNDMGAYGGPYADDWSTCSYPQPPPDAPDNVLITTDCDTLGCDSVFITWDAVTGATSYTVYYSDEPGGTYQEDLSGTFNGASWTAPFVDTKRFYYVTANN